MKYFIIIALLINTSMACDWKTGIVKKGSRYSYTVDCHKEVGKLVKQNKELKLANSERQKQSEKLTQSIKLKDLALEKADLRITNWRNETYNQHDRLLKQKKLSKYNDWLYFVGGMGLTVLSVWGAGQIK